MTAPREQVPALTDAEWRRFEDAVINGMYDEAEADVRLNCAETYAKNAHQLAALALAHQPFGFTHDDVRALLLVASDIGVADSHGAPDPLVTKKMAALTSLASRIQSLLPPISSEDQTK